jgi:hypothetical protein
MAWSTHNDLVSAAVLGALSTGCIGMPYGVPPTTLAIGGGGETAIGRTPSPMWTFRAGINPLGWSNEALTRRFDVGIGYDFQKSGNFLTHGAYAEAGSVIVSSRAPGEGFLNGGVNRIVGYAQLRLLYEQDTGRVWNGAGARFVFEHANYSSGSSSSLNPFQGGHIGVHEGEGAVGFYVELLANRYSSGAYFAATAGLNVRLPAFAGFVWAWIWSLSPRIK